MKILKMKLENFQGVKELEIDPQGESSAIYGDNGTGKSTVYNAFTSRSVLTRQRKQSQTLRAWTNRPLTTPWQRLKRSTENWKARELPENPERQQPSDSRSRNWKARELPERQNM